MLRRAQHERFVADFARRALITVMWAAPLVATPAFASDFSGMIPYLIGAILLAGAVFTGLVFGVTHFLPWPPVKRGLRALAFGLFLAPVQYLSDGSPDTYDGTVMPLGAALMFDEPFNGTGRIALSIAITTAVFYGLFWMIGKLREK
jgi:hypothetical protein